MSFTSRWIGGLATGVVAVTFAAVSAQGQQTRPVGRDRHVRRRPLRLAHAAPRGQQAREVIDGEHRQLRVVSAHVYESG